MEETQQQQIQNPTAPRYGGNNGKKKEIINIEKKHAINNKKHIYDIHIECDRRYIIIAIIFRWSKPANNTSNKRR